MVARAGDYPVRHAYAPHPTSRRRRPAARDHPQPPDDAAALGRIGGLICWENYMPLARFAVFAQGCEIYVAPTWDCGDRWLATMRHIAAEGRCWVIGTGSAMRGKDIPKDFPQRAKIFPNLEEWYNPGDSVVVNPTGTIL